MDELAELQKEIAKIKKRNQRVELDKAWETSWTRKIVLALLTYIVIVIFFLTTHLSNPFTNALVTAATFLLSTLTLSWFKKLWSKNK